MRRPLIFPFQRQWLIGLRHLDKGQNENPYLTYGVYSVMSKTDFYQKLDQANEITLSVKGRKSGGDIPRLVWFVHESDTLYLLPVQGSDTNWYKNMLADPTLKVSVYGVEIAAEGKPITDRNGVDEVVRRFRSKYGEEDVKKYYAKFDVAAQVPL